MTAEPGDQHGRQKWLVCGMLLLALVLNYMDRQTLSLTITAIERQVHTTNAQYGQLEELFGYAFAIGGLVWGLAADRLNVRWLYPLALFGWSAAGVATGFGDRIGDFVTPLFEALTDVGKLSMTDDPEIQRPYLGFLVCRIVLGFFEAGQWPCALVTTQRLLSPQDRPFGNSILQSGASIGAILTPIVIGLFDPKIPKGEDAPPELLGWWRSPYVVIGCLGLLWIVPWLWMVAKVNLQRPAAPAEADRTSGSAPHETPLALAIRRYVGLIVMVIVINAMWQFFRAWLPKILEQSKGYSASDTRWIVVGYYVAADLGCMAAGWIVRVLSARGWNVHWARIASYGACSVLTALSVVASGAERGPLLVAVLLVIGFGALGLFPNYYSFTQELSGRHQGKVSGTLGFITWIVSSKMQKLVGAEVDRTGSYADGIFWIGLAPVLGLFALLLVWGRPSDPRTETKTA